MSANFFVTPYLSALSAQVEPILKRPAEDFMRRFMNERDEELFRYQLT